MRYSGVGGQAVMEGVMMKNQDTYAVAVRKPDKEIEIKVEDYEFGKKFKGIKKVPFIRGVFNFIDSLVLGMNTLMWSASFFEDEETELVKKKKQEMSSEELKKHEAKEKKKEGALMGGTLFVSLLFALALFFALPYFLSTIFSRFIENGWIIGLIEGVIRLVIFMGYICVISLSPDIKRVYMYHGAEHKCINCIEHGLELNVENVRKSTRFHKRCGTSFLIIVMLVSVIFFVFIQVDARWLKLVLRIVLIPVIAGVSYEFIRLAGRFENPVVNLLSLPGLWMQRITTKEPTDDMIEVGIASVEAVFDWKAWQKEEEG